MPMDDEGWPGDAWDEEIPEAPGAGQPGSIPPTGPPPLSTPTPAAGPRPPGGGLSRSAIIAIAAVAVLVIAGVIVGVVATSGKKGSSTTTLQPSTSVTTVSPATTAPGSATTAPAGTTAPSGSLLSNSPFNTCTELTAPERGIPNATDEIECTGSDVSDDGGMAAFFAQFASATAATSYMSELAHAAASSGDCSSVAASDVTARCTFQDQSDESGQGVLYVGENFVFGPDSSTEGDCALLGQPTADGTAVVLWSYSGSDVLGGIVSCSASQTALASMRSGLLEGDYELSNQ